MKGQAPIFSHQADDWETPWTLFQPLHEEFQFTVDAAANASNHLLPNWYGPGSPIAEDALTISWENQRCWLNPPYSMLKQFVAKAALERTRGALTVMLIPSRTDTKCWHEHLWDASQLVPKWRDGVEGRFLKGRVKFIDPTGSSRNSAPFPSVIVVMRPTQ